jgi:hypothetical protein
MYAKPKSLRKAIYYVVVILYEEELKHMGKASQYHQRCEGIPKGEKDFSKAFVL